MAIEAVATWLQQYRAHNRGKPPKDEEVRMRVAATRFFWQRGYIDRAREHVDAALELDKDDSGARLMRGWIANYEQDFQTALEHLQIVRQEEPDDLTAAYATFANRAVQVPNDLDEIIRAIEVYS